MKLFVVTDYDPKNVAITMDGHVVSGYAPDSFVEIKPLGGGITPQVGIDGEVTRLVSTDDTHEITLTLMHTSDTHKLLNQWWVRDRSHGMGLFSISIKDPSTGATHYAARAWVKNVPEYHYGKESGEFKWTIVATSISTTITGPPKFGSLGVLVEKAFTGGFQF